MSRVPASNVKTVKERSGGVCEGCGLKPATEIHHRQYRSRGGNHDISNLMHLCGWGNHTGCHGLAHSYEPPEGWALPSGVVVPSHAPVLRRGVRCLLTDTGDVLTGTVVF